jgi:hypothetical protein
MRATVLTYALPNGQPGEVVPVREVGAGPGHGAQLIGRIYAVEILRRAAYARFSERDAATVDIAQIRLKNRALPGGGPFLLGS